MLDNFLKEIQELKEYKIKYEYAEKDKQQMSDLLFEFMTKEYNNKTYEERVLDYKLDWCRCCRYKGCSYELPQDIGKPIESDKAWIPSTKGCIEFEWS